MRPVQIKKDDWDRKSLSNLKDHEKEDKDVKPYERWYIHCDNLDSGRSYSCSFVEFDERGDYLDFFQHVDALNKIASLDPKPGTENYKAMKETPRPLLVVIYCHGWENDSESDDVVKFNDFLGNLSAAKPKTKDGDLYRVHGVFLGWRGNSFKPSVHTTSPSYTQTPDGFQSGNRSTGLFPTAALSSMVA